MSVFQLEQHRRPLRSAPEKGEPITEREALGWLPHTCFRTGPPRRTGLELELVLTTHGVQGERVPESRRAALLTDLRALPLRSGLTMEPGGQVELSSPPADTVVAAVADLKHDLTLVRRQASWHGLRLSGAGLDPFRAPRRILRDPRYVAMESYFDRAGTAGRVMMCCTASVQVNVEAAEDGGTQENLSRRWRLLHAVGPTLVAAFANSPLHRGRPTGWASTRHAVWWAIDARRTRPVRPLPGEPLPAAYARWCLDAPLMLVRRPATTTGCPDWTAPAGVTFRDWIRYGRQAVPDLEAPTRDDLAYHLTTLFPPVRARGHLEVRYVDAQPGDGWRVPAAVVCALVENQRAGDLALQACAGTAQRWLDAARFGVHDVALRRSAVRVLSLAAGSLRRHETTRELANLVEEFLARYTLRGRHPGDDLLDTVAGIGRPPCAVHPAAGGRP
jgi:glutamate--cysteine ligase